MPNKREGRGSRFVQITAAADDTGVRLFALDNLGQVWEYQSDIWERLYNAREDDEPDV